MKYIHISYLTLLSLCFFNCSDVKKTDKEYFNGEINIVDRDSIKKDSLIAEEIKLEEAYAGRMYVHDSLAFFVSSQYSDHCIYSYDIASESLLGKYCEIGQGPDEVINISSTIQPRIINGELCYWLYSFNDRETRCWNVEKSLKEGKTCYDSIVSIRPNSDMFNFVYVFMLDDYKYLAKGSDPLLLEENKFIPEYRIIDTKKPKDSIESIKIYKRGIREEIDDINQTSFYLTSMDRIRPNNNNKVAMVMYYLAQVNILNIETGKSKAVRLKGTPSFNYLEGDINDLITFYISATVTDDHIYALYSNLRREDESIENKDHAFDEVHVFDWEGNLVRILKLDNEIDQITVDPVNNVLYGMAGRDERIFRFEL